jgi:hypothetical protein
VALFDFYMTYRRQQVQICNAISDACSVKFVALFIYRLSANGSASIVHIHEENISDA